MERMSPWRRLVTGTSAVGLSHMSSLSRWYMSSFRLGYWPVPVTAAVLTMTGGKTSLYPCFLCMSRKKQIRALSSLAPSPFRQ